MSVLRALWAPTRWLSSVDRRLCLHSARSPAARGTSACMAPGWLSPSALERPAVCTPPGADAGSVAAAVLLLCITAAAGGEHVAGDTGRPQASEPLVFLCCVVSCWAVQQLASAVGGVLCNAYSALVVPKWALQRVSCGVAVLWECHLPDVHLRPPLICGS
jgi:hypothetical protein